MSRSLWIIIIIYGFTIFAFLPATMSLFNLTMNAQTMKNNAMCMLDVFGWVKIQCFFS